MMLKRNLLKHLIDLKSKTIIGLNSGTSADGVDAAVIKVGSNSYRSNIEYITGATYKFAPKLRAKILRYAEPDFRDGVKWLELDLELAKIFAEAAKKIARKAGLSMTDIDFIGSHGQTIRHLPYDEYGPITHQIGDPGRIAVLTGIATVGDFRIADVATGGQGAPLTPIVNAILFSKLKKPYAVLNIGGIANISVIFGRGRSVVLAGADTGPGNMPVDYLMRKFYRQNFDKDGRIAASGRLNQSLIDTFLTRGFFKRKGVKSAGREDFGRAFAEDFLSRCRKKKITNADIIATASELTTAAVAKFTVMNKLKFNTLLLTGGGAKNRYFIDSLKRLLPGVEIKRVSDYNYPEDYLEAISFAILANEAICSNKYNLRDVTGSRKMVVAGKICQA
jgi:anhydro-N-acetylmuramic acid kinase